MTAEQIRERVDAILSTNATAENNQLITSCNLESIIRRWRTPLSALLNEIQESTVLDPDLTAIAETTGAGFLKRVSEGNWTIDTTTYLSSLTGIAVGGGLTGTLPNPGIAPTGVVAGTYGSATLIPILTLAADGRVTGMTTAAINAGVSTVGTIDGQPKATNGATILGTSIYLQDADATNRGLMSGGIQTIGGAKTFNGAMTIASALNTFGAGDMVKNGGLSVYSETYRTGNNAGFFSYVTAPAGSYLGMNFGINGTNGGTRDHSQKFRFWAGSVGDISPLMLGTTSPAVYAMDFPNYHDVSVCMYALNSASRYYRIKTDNTSGSAVDRFGIQGYAANAIAYFNNIIGLGIGTTSPQASALMDVVSTTQGSRPYPRMTAAQRTAITVSASTVGLHVYQTDGTEGVYVYKSSGWALGY